MSATFSVVTPCLDQGDFLARCIESVAGQQHRAIEHLVFDPGSSDNSREIAAAAQSVELIAEPDNGQADAVRRGFDRATGDVIAWLNADDRYIDDHVFGDVAKRFAQSDQPDVVYGTGRYESPSGEHLGDAFVFDPAPGELVELFMHGVGLLQPAVFLHRRALDRIAGPDPGLRFAMDYDLWIRLALAGASFARMDRDLAIAVIHPEAKTQSMRGESIEEAVGVASNHFGFVTWSWCQLQATWQVTGSPGLIETDSPDEVDERKIRQRTGELFVERNRNLSTVKQLFTPPWSRTKATTLARLVNPRSITRGRAAQ